jgi:hypothetical protein
MVYRRLRVITVEIGTHKESYQSASAKDPAAVAKMRRENKSKGFLKNGFIQIYFDPRIMILRNQKQVE